MLASTLGIYLLARQVKLAAIAASIGRKARVAEHILSKPFRIKPRLEPAFSGASAFSFPVLFFHTSRLSSRLCDLALEHSLECRQRVVRRFLPKRPRQHAAHVRAHGPASCRSGSG